MGVEIGKWAFVVGLVLAVLAGLVTSLNVPLTVYVLAVLGIVVGFLNVTEKETVPFLVATIALMLTSTSLAVLGVATLTAIFTNVAVFAAPAALVVAIKAVYSTASAD